MIEVKEKEDRKMKRSLLVLIALFSLLLFSGPAWSLVIQGTSIQVGDRDICLTASSGVGSSEADELAWIISTTGDSSLVFGGKLENSSMIWQRTDQAYTWAISFGAMEPSYFLIKTGNLNPGGTPLQYWILFENTSLMNWGVVDLASNLDLGSYEFTDIKKISHVTMVPEPGTMLLLGIGLLGLGVSARRKI
jgi:hypothetical protein